MAKAVSAKETKPNIIARLRTFYGDVRQEMTKVTWSSREEIKASTSVVLTLLVVLATLIGIFDKVCEWGVVSLLHLGN